MLFKVNLSAIFFVETFFFILLDFNKIKLEKMKKFILFALLFVFAISFAQETTKKIVKKTAKKGATTKIAVAKLPVAVASLIDGPGMVFETENLNYGTVEYGSEGKREFVLTNNGNKPLIITNAQGSCGCTVPSYPKDPIAPGAKAIIGVKYDTNRPGTISKSITLTTNVVGQESKVIFISGTVLPNAQAVPATVTPAVKS